MDESAAPEAGETPRPAGLAGLAGALRERRRRAGLSLEELATRSGVSRSMISKVERGEAVPSTVVLSRLAEALGATFAQLMLPGTEGEFVHIPRARQPELRDAETGFIRRVLSPVLPGRGVDFVLNTLPPGASTGSFAAHRPGVEEYIFVLRGRLAARVGSHAATLEAGDSVFFDASGPHEFINAGRGECEYLLVIDSSNRR